MQTHLVNRLRFDMTCPSDEQAMRVGADFEHTIQPLLVAAIDRVCSRHVEDHQWVRFDKLTIDLPVFPAGLPPAELLEAQFETAFETAFLTYLTRLPTETRAASRESTDLETVVFFLKTGQLPWWAVADTTDLEVMVNALIDRLPGAVGAGLPPVLRHEQSLQRLLYQFTAATLERLVEHCFPELVAWVTTTLESQPLTAGFRAQPKSGSGLVSGWPAVYLRLLPYTADEVAMAHVLPAVVAQVFGVSGQPWPLSKLPEAPQPVAKDSLANGPVTDYGPTQAGDDAVEKYLVKSAGIVLLAPFINDFFREVGWLDNGAFRDEAAQYKALHGLHFLATGQRHPPEYQLTLEKLLCGLPLDAPVPRVVDLPDAEYGEADTLLAEVVALWKTLKNTSVDGFRAGFLHRDGILTRLGTNWQLTVERNTIDVLLDTLPWGFSTAKLPWMPQLLFTQW